MSISQGELPRVSVVMPIRNEGTFIARSLGAVVGQDYPADRLQVIVADGMSTDGTREIVKELQKRHRSIILVDNPARIVPTAMNAGIRVAEGDIIVRVDGHTIISRDYVRNCVAELQRTGADNVGGRMLAVSRGLLGRAIAMATSSPFGVGGARFHYSDREEWVDTVYMGAWPKGVFAQIGLFDEEMVRNQDDELNYRLRAHGGKILLCPNIRSEYFNRATVGSLAKQYFQYGCWKVRVLQKHPRQMSLRHFVPPLFILCLSVSCVGAPFSVIAWRVFITTACLYLIANLSSSFLLTMRKHWEAMPILPLVFIMLHVSYGSGFIAGLFRFWNRWGRRSQSTIPEVESVQSKGVD
jgi:succinoglycan biosynthesis protein ExoA